jgi:Ca2+-binding EF-hand superfamily protein
MADKKLTEEEVADLKEAFAMFDINGDGKLSFIALTTIILRYDCIRRVEFRSGPNSIPL